MLGTRTAPTGRIHSTGLAALIALAFSLGAPLAQASELDHEIDQLKAQVAQHSAAVYTFEQKILYPASTRLAVFLTQVGQAALSLDAVELFLNGQPVTSHLYSERERDSLEQGGVQQLFVGNLPNGEHELKIVVSARSVKDTYVRRETIHRFEKRPGSTRLQLSLDAPAPDFAPRVSLVDWK